MNVTEETLAEIIEAALDDSMDYDWTTGRGARAAAAALLAGGHMDTRGYEDVVVRQGDVAARLREQVTHGGMNPLGARLLLDWAADEIDRLRAQVSPVTGEGVVPVGSGAPVDPDPAGLPVQQCPRQMEHGPHSYYRGAYRCAGLTMLQVERRYPELTASERIAEHTGHELIASGGLAGPPPSWWLKESEDADPDAIRRHYLGDGAR